MEVIKDAMEGRKIGCLLFEYRGGTLEEIKTKHYEEKIDSIVNKSNGNIQVYIKKEAAKVAKKVVKSTEKINETKGKVQSWLKKAKDQN